MSGNVRTLRGPAILLETVATLESLTYPASLNSGLAPTVYFMDDDDNKRAERIEVVGQLSNAVVDWNATGGIQQEDFEIKIDIYAGEAGQTGAQAVARAVVLSEVVQAGFRDTVTGQPTGLVTAGTVKNYRIVGYDFTAFPVTNEGWGVLYSLTLRVAARL